MALPCPPLAVSVARLCAFYGYTVRHILSESVEIEMIDDELSQIARRLGGDFVLDLPFRLFDEVIDKLIVEFQQEIEIGHSLFRLLGG